MTRTIVSALALAVVPHMGFASDLDSAMQTFVDETASAWLQSEVLISAITNQNQDTGSFDATMIESLDTQWRSEVGSASDLIDGVLINSAADFLRDRVAESNGQITEVFVMDALGLNVAASGATSDYWQGDEDKFQKTYPMGAGATHFSEVEFDESSQTYQVQISVTIADPATQSPIGAITIGIDAESLM
ncbi:PDC sensor domain-containing protein [Shimia sp.]|uniref:PDC sensor domain-containing protein n=1 Tax=Shimia sp. TaxID=1954381 RepID=UPI003B8D5AA3